MTTQDSVLPPRPARGFRPLFWWPIALFTLTIVLLLFADRVSAWHRTEGHSTQAWRHHGERLLDRILLETEATDEQATAIRAIARETFDLLAAARAEGNGDAERLRALLSAEPLDRAALEALRSAHVERADVLSEALAERFADALDVLTAEQRRRLIARADEFRAHHRNHHGHDDGPRHPDDRPWSHERPDTPAPEPSPSKDGA